MTEVTQFVLKRFEYELPEGEYVIHKEYVGFIFKFN